MGEVFHVKQRFRGVGRLQLAAFRKRTCDGNSWDALKDVPRTGRRIMLSIGV